MQRDQPADITTDRHTETDIYRLKERDRKKQTDRQRGRLTERGTDRQGDRQTSQTDERVAYLQRLEMQLVATLASRCGARDDSRPS